MVNPTARAEESFWKDSATILGPEAAAKVSDIRDAWMRRVWLERPGDTTVAMTPGIDLSAYLQRRLAHSQNTSSGARYGPR